jgi:hypothetical protein
VNLGDANAVAELACLRQGIVEHPLEVAARQAQQPPRWEAANRR